MLGVSGPFKLSISPSLLSCLCLTLREPLHFGRYGRNEEVNAEDVEGEVAQMEPCPNESDYEEEFDSEWTDEDSGWQSDAAPSPPAED